MEVAKKESEINNQKKREREREFYSKSFRGIGKTYSGKVRFGSGLFIIFSVPCAFIKQVFLKLLLYVRRYCRNQRYFSEHRQKSLQ